MAKIRILIAEDQQIVRAGLCALLERPQTLEVVGEAGDGEEAVRLVEELEPDVVVMDVGMPRVNGIQATKTIRLTRPQLPILGLSSHEEDHFVFPMLDAGANGYLLKSTNPDELIRAIHLVHAGGTILDPTIASKVVNRLKNKQMSNNGDRFEGLSQREIDVLQMAAYGKSSKEVGMALYISPHTVQAHLRNIFAKLEVGSRAEAVAYALHQSWISMDGLIK